MECGPLSESRSMYTECRTHFTTGLACMLFITRKYMDHVGRLPANCALTVYYLPVYPPYNDYNCGLRTHNWWGEEADNTQRENLDQFRTTEG